MFKSSMCNYVQVCPSMYNHVKVRARQQRSTKRPHQLDAFLDQGGTGV